MFNFPLAKTQLGPFLAIHLTALIRFTTVPFSLLYTSEIPENPIFGVLLVRVTKLLQIRVNEKRAAIELTATEKTNPQILWLACLVLA